MAGEKYVVAASDNPLQVAIRNILNPGGYIFLGNCSDSVTFLRLIRSYHPDFIVIDMNLRLVEMRNTLETVDDEMLCPCIIIGDCRDMEINNLMEKSRILSFCPKPLNREILMHTVELSHMFYKRICEMDHKLRDMTENYETRKVIEKAKWILIEREGISESEAYERMRKKSMDSRLSMKLIAEAVIFTHDIGNKG